MSRESGKRYEDIACEYLKKTGYRIIARNVTYRFGEIDIVALEGKILVFVEVKGGSSLVLPRYRVDERKIRRLELAAQRYILIEKPEFDEARLDVIEILGNGVVNHIRSVGRW
ncbi:MAG: YraN family protein [Kosmotogaceae bacterium]|nr:YraN family protein [Kosmotogaceae bacterium]